MALYESIIRPLAFLFDPEWVHENVMHLISNGLFQVRPIVDERLTQNLFSVQFPNPLGLAAGFDKNAVASEAWEDLGFGFAEVGTVTYLAQPGNPRPRLFRLPEDKALINRMGFNNDGAESMAARLSMSRPHVPIGINLGKNKQISHEDAPRNYARCYSLLHSYGDYFVINVSSPNTPGLRELQEKSALKDIVAAIQSIDSTRPLFIKVAPDLEISALDDVIEVAHDCGLTGLVATNTTITRPELRVESQEAGGLSGAPLKGLAGAFMAHLYKSCQPEIVLMGVGGISNGDDLYERIGQGAHLCQIYTGWIYGGPTMAVDSVRRLVERMDRDGLKHVSELRGKLVH
jgi:dihydroorotate dehydrogenase